MKDILFTYHNKNIHSNGMSTANILIISDDLYVVKMSTYNR